MSLVENYIRDLMVEKLKEDNRAMLEALRKADAWISMYREMPGHDAASRLMSDALRAVIAKVEGRA